MKRYFVDVGGDTRRDETVRAVLETIVAVGRPVSSVEILGNRTPLRNRDDHAVQILASRPGIEIGPGETIQGETDATCRVIEAARTLLSGALIELVFRDANEDIVFARYDRSTHYFQAKPTHAERITKELPSDATVHPVDRKD